MRFRKIDQISEDSDDKEKIKNYPFKLLIVRREARKLPRVPVYEI